MSQHDFNIANQTFPSFRADLNDALVAAATMSAGASAPTTPYPYQLWFDTTTGTWKVRNSGNTAWVSTITTDLATGKVGIGTANPDQLLHLAASSGATLRFESTTTGATTGDIFGAIEFETQDSNSAGIKAKIDAYSEGSVGNTALRFHTGDTVSLDEAMRIDSSGNVGISKTAYGSISTDGFWWENGASKYLALSGTGTSPIYLNRNGSDGGIVNFYKSGTTVGSIGSANSGADLYINSTDDLFLRANGLDGIQIFQSGGSLQQISCYTNLYPSTDNAFDVGTASLRWDDIFATNGTIQTSDANEKQQIAALTDAEMTAAKAISALFKTFKWNDAVAEKGDAARTHTGVIAQDVQAAMTAAGLDAGDYAFFISSTWWETQTEVPAVEAVDAVYEDVVIPTVLDDDGNEVEAERTEQRTVTEAVEAVAAYTRTDTYDTAEEAPEGATERTRMGIRYPELLAFIGAATEQRLSNIETRLAALEA